MFFGKQRRQPVDKIGALEVVDLASFVPGSTEIQLRLHLADRFCREKQITHPFNLHIRFTGEHLDIEYLIRLGSFHIGGGISEVWDCAWSHRSTRMDQDAFRTLGFPLEFTAICAFLVLSRNTDVELDWQESPEFLDITMRSQRCLAPNQAMRSDCPHLDGGDTGPPELPAPLSPARRMHMIFWS